jgi:ribulose-5-phosphate 4-epimerase/fuculose-1-phosphate aldolase
MAVDIEELRERVALACRILSYRRIMREVTGHISLRIPGTNEMLLRCRGRKDPGVAGTTPKDIRRVDLDGNSEELEGYWLPGEFSLHAEILRARPEVQAVVHGHPRSSLLCGIAGLELRPIFGAYDPNSAALALDQIGFFPGSMLISTPELGRQLVEAIGGRVGCLLKGHGIVTTGRSLEDATVKAIRLETLADVTVQVAQLGRTADNIPESEMDGLRAMNVEHEKLMGVTQWTFDAFAKALDGGIDPS